MSDGLNAVWAYWRSGGILLIPLAWVCLGIFAGFLRSRAHLMSLLDEGQRLAERLNDLSPASGAPGLRSTLERPGHLAEWMHRALDAAEKGVSPAQWFPRREEMARMALGRDQMVLAALTAMAPLLGLLGTVVGMISTFDAVSVSAGATATRVAGGISSALITTQFGLVIALPGVFGLVRIERLLRRLDICIAECRHRLCVALGVRPE